MTDLPFSQACENNKHAILDRLTVAFANSTCVLEIGSGTGQHAVHFAPSLPHVTWLTSDRVENHPGINAWIEQALAPNLHPPMAFSLPASSWPERAIDAVYSANTAHIMQKNEAKAMMQLIDASLPTGGNFCQYGPFTIDGKFSSQSNEDFHQSLIERGYGGYRDIQELIDWAPSLGLVQVHEMPANNLMLHWRKS